MNERGLSKDLSSIVSLLDLEQKDTLIYIAFEFFELVNIKIIIHYFIIYIYC